MVPGGAGPAAPSSAPMTTTPWTGPVPPGPARKEPRRRRGRARTNLLIVSVVALLLAGALGGAYWFLEQEAVALTAQADSARTLLEQSDGRVAEPATREALVQHLATADQVLAGTPFLERRPGDADAATEDLVAASDRVWASMIDRARADIATGRQDLTAVIGTADRTFAATDGLQDPARAAVQKSLAAAAKTQASTSEDNLAGADLPALENAVAALAERNRSLTAATDTLVTAQDATVCPQPDQLWSPDSGRVPADRLAAIPWAPGFEVRKDVLDSLVALNAEYKAEFGQNLTINSAYRSYESQVALIGDPDAAPPGCSSHGLGLAVDINMGPQQFSSPTYLWLKEHAAAHGWAHPRWADADGRLPEPWHWQSVKSPEETL